MGPAPTPAVGACTHQVKGKEYTLKSWYDDNCKLGNFDKKACTGKGCQWKGGKCKPLPYKGGKTKKIKCKKVKDEETCGCFDACKPKMKKKKFKSCTGGNQVFNKDK